MSPLSYLWYVGFLTAFGFQLLQVYSFLKGSSGGGNVDLLSSVTNVRT